jgi:prepilin-type N-terminal cleavage/methylation domain-containing protein
MRARRSSSGFTLLELLIVVAIIAVLATLILGGLASARRRTQVAVAKNNIEALKAALVAYESDTGRFPRRSTATAGSLFYNDIAYVYAALRYRRIVANGGGPNSPYVDWKPEQLSKGSLGSGWTQGTLPDFGNVNPTTNTQAPPWFTQLDQTEWDSVNDNTYQLAHLCTSADPLIFCDPWGNPYVYREWASVPTQLKDSSGSRTTSSTVVQSGGTGGGTPDTWTDRVHDPSKFDIYSFGPNGVNEFGNGDDVTSWTNAGH